MSALSFALRLRMSRLFNGPSGRIFVVPMDHSVTTGPIVDRSGGMNCLVGRLASNGVDAVVLHKGTVRHLDPGSFASLALVVHLSVSTVHAPDPDAKYLVTGVEEAVRLGADAVSVHVNLGSNDERRQIADLGAVAEGCDRWNVPLLAMVYPRGPHIVDPHEPDLVAHSAALAADLGADIVKTVHARSTGAMADIVRGCPIPVVVAGGPALADTDDALAQVKAALDSGAAGVAMGRNVFQADDPAAVAQRVAGLVHRRAHPVGTREFEMTAG